MAMRLSLISGRPSVLLYRGEFPDDFLLVDTGAKAGD